MKVVVGTGRDRKVIEIPDGVVDAVARAGLAALVARIGQPGGVADLDGNGRLPGVRLPDAAVGVRHVDEELLARIDAGGGGSSPVVSLAPAGGEWEITILPAGAWNLEE